MYNSYQVTPIQLGSATATAQYLVLAGPLHRDIEAVVEPAVLQKLGDGDAPPRVGLEHASQQFHHLRLQPLWHLIFAVLGTSTHKTKFVKKNLKKLTSYNT